MKPLLTGLVFATVIAAAALPARADDTPAPAAPPVAAAPAPQAAPAAAPPANVPRPSIVPQTTEAAAAPSADPAPRPHRRHAHRRYYRQYAYWEPIPIYLPRFFHHRITWSRIHWFAF